MRKHDCVGFLQWCLPQLGLRWSGYRKVRGTVCKRIVRRMRELQLADFSAYRNFIEQNPGEFEVIEEFSHIPISRFFRDRLVFESLANRLFPELVEAARSDGREYVTCWSAGCASGEEVYSLAIAWAIAAPRSAAGAQISIVATDADQHLLERAKAGRYKAGSLKELPEEWIERAFVNREDVFEVRQDLRNTIRFGREDIREDQPSGPFDLILCRNMAFTYFTQDVQKRVFQRLDQALRPGGYLIIGAHETLPTVAYPYQQLGGNLPIYQKADERVRCALKGTAS